MREFPETTQIVDYLLEHGKDIAADAEQGNQDAKKVMLYYTLFHRSPDPLFYLLLKRSINAWSGTKIFNA